MVEENVDFIDYVKSAVPLHTHTESIDFGSRTTTVRASVHANQWTAFERSACPSRGSAARPARARSAARSGAASSTASPRALIRTDSHLPSSHKSVTQGGPCSSLLFRVL